MPPDDGTWRYTWPAGERFLAEIAGLVPVAGRQVIDLGCGRGRLGRWALAAGAAEVVFADVSAEALAGVGATGSVRLLEHAWGDPLPACDVLLGGDILYRPAAFAALLDSIATALVRPGSVAWLVDPRTRLEPELPQLAVQRRLSWEPERRPAGYTRVCVRLLTCETGVV